VTSPTTAQAISSYRHPDLVRLVERPHDPFSTGSQGRQWILRFRSGYGASILDLKGAPRAGGLELAVLRWQDEGEENFTLCYDTPVTSDVLAQLDVQDCLGILDRVAALRPDARALPGALLHHLAWEG
jgi:hypothetical protein